MDIRRRTRFRRDIPLRNEKRNGFSKDGTGADGILSDLGSRLATFKASPMLLDGVNRPPRPFFIGACAFCCPHSKATLGTERSVPIQGLENIFSLNQWHRSKKFALHEPVNSSNSKLYRTEKEFESKVIHPKRRFIENVLSLNDSYNSQDVKVWYQLMNLKLDTVFSWLAKIRQFIVERIIRKIFPQGLIYHPGQIAVIKRSLVSENPLVFLAVKQSAMDSVIAQRLLTNEFELPTINVEESFENKTFFNSLCNLFKRAFSNGKFRLLPPNEQMSSDLVWSVQQEVIQSLLEDRSNLIVSLNPFKVNCETVKREEQCQFLSSLIEVLQSDKPTVMDINIVPMSLTYDMKFENLFDWDSGLSLQALFSNMTKLFSILLLPGQIGCGKVRLDLDQPFSLREFIKNADKYSDSSNEYDAERYTQSLHNHLVWNSCNLRRFSACDIYSFSKFHVPHLNLVPSFEKVVADIRTKNRDVAFSGQTLPVIDYASKFGHRMQGNINLSKDLLSLYLGEMVMSSATCALLNTSAISTYKDTHAQIKIGSKPALLEEAKLLINLVHYEFPSITPPCKDNLDEFLMDIFDNFVGNNHS